ncbi:MAG: helix-turn-helix transcriptional regulator [Chloroflexota bacterium]
MKNVVGKNVAKIREKMGITQEQLAVQLQMSGWRVDRFLISKIERGERQVLDSEVVLIANALKVSINSLFERDE